MKIEIELYHIAAGAVAYVVWKIIVRFVSCRHEARVSEDAKALAEPFAEPETEETCDEPEVEVGSPQHDTPLQTREFRGAMMHASVMLLCALPIILTTRFPVESLQPMTEGGNISSDVDARGQEGNRSAHLSRLSSSLAPAAEEQLDRGDKIVKVQLKRESRVSEGAQGQPHIQSAYSGTVNVGSSFDGYTFVFDTGSGYVVVPMTGCKSKACKHHKRYNRAASKTARDVNFDGSRAQKNDRDFLTLEFGTGVVDGLLVEEVVCADSVHAGAENSKALMTGDSLPPGCTRMRMIGATTMSDYPFTEVQADGVIGLGMAVLSEDPHYNFVHMMSRQLGTDPIFALFFSRDDGGELAIGGYNPEHLEGEDEVAWLPVAHAKLGHWMVKVKTLRIDDNKLDYCNDDCYAVMDSGTSLVAVPTDSFLRLFRLLRHRALMDGECRGGGPLMHFDLEGDRPFTMTLGPEDYAQPTKSKNKDLSYGPDLMGPTRDERSDLTCRPLLMTMDMPNPLPKKLFILGEPALRKYYTVYDSGNDRIGFGLARHDSTEVAVVDTEDDSWFYEK